MSSTRDYTDSESDGEGGVGGGTPSRPLDAVSSFSTPRGGSPAASSPLKPSDPLRIKLRPGPSHLANSSRPASSSVSPPPTDGDGEDTPGGDAAGPASSPPKFKIRLAGMKHSLGSNAQYSSSDESEGGGKSGGGGRKEPPAKKRRTSKKGSVGSKEDKPTGPQLPAQHRKTYNWLQPSAAGASHHGPPDREGRERLASHVSLVDSERRSVGASGGVTSDDGSARGSAPPESGKKKRRRGADAGSGPGKNWRKGLKKGDPIPWKDGTTFLGKSSPLATPSRGSMSRDVSPDLDDMLLAAASPKRERDGHNHDDDDDEEDELNDADVDELDPDPPAPRPVPVHSAPSRARVRERDRDRPREPSPPFELADAAKLGFPVFSKPIVAPKIVLGPFPKVTQFFAPFDQKPFRKEKVRDWSHTEKSVPGIGGSTLKFKTWARGPTSELGVLLQAQREADAAAKAAKRESKLASKDSEPPPDRPALHHSLSTGSVSRAASVDGDNDSELGDGDDHGTSTPSVRESPAPSPRRRGAAGGKKAERKPRKSKLAQEITLTEPEGSAPPSEAGDAETKDAAAVEA